MTKKKVIGQLEQILAEQRNEIESRYLNTPPERLRRVFERHDTSIESWIQLFSQDKYSPDVVDSAFSIIETLSNKSLDLDLDNLIPYLDSPSLMEHLRGYVDFARGHGGPNPGEAQIMLDKLKIDSSSRISERYENVLTKLRESESPILAETLDDYVSKSARYLPENLIPIVSTLEEFSDDPIAVRYILENPSLINHPDLVSELSKIERILGNRGDSYNLWITQISEKEESFNLKIPYLIEGTNWLFEAYDPTQIKMFLLHHSIHFTKSSPENVAEYFNILMNEDTKKVMDVFTEPLDLQHLLGNVFLSFREDPIASEIGSLSKDDSLRDINKLKNILDNLETTDYNLLEYPQFLINIDLNQAERVVSYLQQPNGCKTLSELSDMISLEAEDYKVIKKLGSGKYADTYLVETEEVSGNYHAFKIAENLGSEARVQFMKDYSHENIAKLVDIKTVKYKGKTTRAINMEFVKGQTLKEKIDAEGKLETPVVFDYALQVAEGLEFLDSHQVRHKDLKPDNVVIREDSLVKIIDFGLSSTADIANNNLFNRLCGAPEYRLGKEHASSDVWSFGMIVYEMITGESFIKLKGYDNNSEEFKDHVVDVTRKWAEQGKIDEEHLAKIDSIENKHLLEVLQDTLQINPDDRISYSNLVTKLSELKQVKSSSEEVMSKEYSGRSKGYASAVKTYKDVKLRIKTRKLFDPSDVANLKDTKVLDIACGQGDTSLCFQRRKNNIWEPIVGEIYYLDITPSMIQKGIDKGQIKNNSQFISHRSAKERLPYACNFLDFAITRYFLHDLDPEKQNYLLSEVNEVLKPGGKFQLVDMVATPETREFYNLYHGLKRKGDFEHKWILTEPEYKKLFSQNGFDNIQRDTYTSKVNTVNWLQEGQITPEKFQELDDLFRSEIQNNGVVKEYFNLREGANGLINIDFPVILLCGEKVV